MYTILIETAAVGDHPPYVDESGEPQSLDPGTRANVELILEGDQDTSENLIISGNNGSVTYGGQKTDIKAKTRNPDGKLVPDPKPFEAGKIAAIDLALDPPLDLGQLQKMLLSHDGQTLEEGWYPKKIAIIDTDKDRTFGTDLEQWLVPPQAQLEKDLLLDYTTPAGIISPYPNLDRLDLSREFLIKPMDGVRFIFNDTVDRSTFKVQRTQDRRANTLSIRYMDDPEGTNISPEVSATTADLNWSEDESGRITRPGRYIWESDNALLIGPPEGGWPYGKYIRFEFDRSLSDDSGNYLIHGRDQIVIAHVMGETSITIDVPVKDRTYLPWESEDNVYGDPDDFFVYVAGTVTQKGAKEHVQSIYVTATNDNGKSVLSFGYQIEAGPTPHDNLTPRGVGTTRWIPRTDYGGQWAINLPLRDPNYKGPGAQAVAEGRYKWEITATVITKTGARIASNNSKIVYHEIYKPRVTRVYRDPNDLLYIHEEGKDPVVKPLKINAKQAGPNNFTFHLKGDFASPASFQYENTYEMTVINQFLGADIYQSDTAPQGEEWAEVTLPTFVIDTDPDLLLPNGQRKNDTMHTLTFRAKTKAGSVIILHLPYKVDTIPLDIEEVQAVTLSFL